MFARVDAGDTGVVYTAHWRTSLNFSDISRGIARGQGIKGVFIVEGNKPGEFDARGEDCRGKLGATREALAGVYVVDGFFYFMSGLAGGAIIFIVGQNILQLYYLGVRDLISLF